MQTIKIILDASHRNQTSRANPEMSRANAKT